MKGYPTKAAILRAVQAARAAGLDAAGIEIGPNGVIRVFEARAQQSPRSAFDRLEHLL
ncbi:MAG: hypothetical protein WDN44_07795 [Sphingomonas sp.]